MNIAERATVVTCSRIGGARGMAYGIGRAAFTCDDNGEPIDTGLIRNNGPEIVEGEVVEAVRIDRDWWIDTTPQGVPVGDRIPDIFPIGSTPPGIG